MAESFADRLLDAIAQKGAPICVGFDALEPFFNVARGSNKGLFVLIRTSNPGSNQTQDVKLEDGRTYSEMLADLLREKAQAFGAGRHGFSSMGAVVGATQTHAMQSL